MESEGQRVLYPTSEPFPEQGEGGRRNWGSEGVGKKEGLGTGSCLVTLETPLRPRPQADKANRLRVISARHGVAVWPWASPVSCLGICFFIGGIKAGVIEMKMASHSVFLVLTSASVLLWTCAHGALYWPLGREQSRDCPGQGLAQRGRPAKCPSASRGDLEPLGTPWTNAPG